MGKEEMTSKERMMIALSGGIPDRVPVAPDISNMVPCRLTGKPFWDIYLHANPSTAICRQAGVLTGMHSCGIQKHLIRQCVAHTDLGYVNPLEIPPMGDCILREEKYGDKIALMGNLHTTSVMLNPNPDVVLLESLRAIRDAGPGGGFVLSTGDQCGRDTLDENILTMIRAGKEYGQYPLDMERIQEKIEELEKELKV